MHFLSSNYISESKSSPFGLWWHVFTRLQLQSPTAAMSVDTRARSLSQITFCASLSSGLAQCAELCWQLRGQADRRQVPGAKVALQHNIGLGGAVVVALYRLGFPQQSRSGSSFQRFYYFWFILLCTIHLAEFIFAVSNRAMICRYWLVRRRQKALHIRFYII